MIYKYGLSFPLSDYNIQKGLTYGFLASFIPIGIAHSLQRPLPSRVRMFYPEIMIGSALLGGLISYLLAKRRRERFYRELQRLQERRDREIADAVSRIIVKRELTSLD